MDLIAGNTDLTDFKFNSNESRNPFTLEVSLFDTLKTQQKPKTHKLADLLIPKVLKTMHPLSHTYSTHPKDYQRKTK